MISVWRGSQTAWPYARGDFEIGQILHLKSEIRNLRLDCLCRRVLLVQFEISDFGFEMQDSSNFKIPLPSCPLQGGKCPPVIHSHLPRADSVQAADSRLRQSPPHRAREFFDIAPLRHSAAQIQQRTRLQIETPVSRIL